MDQAIVVGNCQAVALEMQLSSVLGFAERFSLKRFPAVHEISEDEVSQLHEALEDTDLLIVQKVSDDYRERLGLGSDYLASLAQGAEIIRWPSLYWNGYMPNLFYLRDAEGQPVVDGAFDYHDRTVLSAYAEGLTSEETVDRLSDPELPSEAATKAAQSTEELGLRSSGCDVTVTDYVRDRFQSELLFFTMNHPSNSVLRHLRNKILDYLEISRPNADAEPSPVVEVLASTLYPLHASDARQLQLLFEAPIFSGPQTPVRIRGAEYPAADVIRAFFSYYSRHPELVALNADH